MPKRLENVICDRNNLVFTVIVYTKKKFLTEFVPKPLTEKIKFQICKSLKSSKILFTNVINNS